MSQQCLTLVREGASLVNLASASGARDFLRSRTGVHEWSLLVVEAKVDSTIAAYGEIREVRRHVPNVARNPPEEAEHFVFVLRLACQAWTLVLRTLNWIDATELVATVREARALSERLGTRAVAFTGTDTSLSVAYQMFERGDSIEDVRWDGEKLTTFDSGRPRPAVASIEEDGGEDHRDADRFFASHDIYLPGCDMSDDPPGLELIDVDAEGIDQIDFLELGPTPKGAPRTAAVKKSGWRRFLPFSG